MSDDSSEEEIKKAYHQLLKKYHPDKTKTATAKARYEEIKQAYDKLKNGEQKASRIIHFSILEKNERNEFVTEDRFYKQMLQNLNKMETAIVYYINVR